MKRTGPTLITMESQNPISGQVKPHSDKITSELPVSTPSNNAISVSKKLTLIPLIFLIYFEVAGGPYGEEPAVQAAGPLFAILGFLIFPFIWSVPEALITAELSTAFPGNGGFVIWAEKAFGPFWGSLMGTWKFLSGVINIAAFPIKPHRWISLGQKGVKRDWNLFFNCLFWNLNFWDNVSTLAGEVENPQKNFPMALLVAVIFTCTAYLIPLIAVIGAVDVDQSKWETGFHAQAAEIIAGKWLKIWLEFGSVLSAIGLFEAQLSSSAYQVLGMANIGILPKLCATRSKKFNTPFVGIVVSTLIALALSYMNFTVIISSANFLYALGMLLEFASFVWLRRKMPTLKRPYKVPMKIPGLIIMCLVPSSFLIFVMIIATKTVFLVSGVMTAAGMGWFLLMRFCKSKKLLKFSETDHELN
ncbi:hypothetical protein G4B88_019297 [Cannabis sativa]|uniref:Uncharacterized protein n=1 Tax=Cannabis sativa TaxID=3483 RepID=A0A7J6DVN8_CANSA|nr:hypothetical protein G4B88_019297 [Cannabis sativa]